MKLTSSRRRGCTDDGRFRRRRSRTRRRSGDHGGPQVDAGSFHVEIVPKGDAARRSICAITRTRRSAPKAFRGIAIFVIDGKPERITLTPAGDNQLKGASSVDLPAEPKGAVQITTPTGSTVQAKFN